MVMPERLASVAPSSPESSASAAARVVAAPVVAAAEFTDAPKRRSFTAKYKLRILAETEPPRVYRRLIVSTVRRLGQGC